MPKNPLTEARSPSRTTAPTAMTSVVQHRYGSAPEEVLSIGHTERPTFAADQALIRVHAASVDRGTWHVMAGLPYPLRLAGFGLRRPKYANPGRALAGTVHAVGSGVTGFAPGDEVYGIGFAAFAEYAPAPIGKLVPKPGNLSFAQAAAVPISGLTALQAVRDHGHVRSGEQVLIIGASGGVGSFAVQIAKAAGAAVTGVCSAAKMAEVRALGADDVIDYTAEDVTDGRRRYDVIIDTGGNRRLSHLRRALTSHGRLVIVGSENGGRWLGGTDRQIRARVWSLFLSQQMGSFINSENATDLATLRDMIEAGTITPAVDRSYPLSATPAAIRHMLDGHARGKIVIAVQGAEQM